MFSIIQTLSENVILPIAGLIITFILCYELITMITEKNNMHDIDTFMFFKFLFKACAAVVIATHTFDIIMGVFVCAVCCPAKLRRDRLKYKRGYFIGYNRYTFNA